MAPIPSHQGPDELPLLLGGLRSTAYPYRTMDRLQINQDPESEDEGEDVTRGPG